MEIGILIQDLKHKKKRRKRVSLPATIGKGSSPNRRQHIKLPDDTVSKAQAEITLHNEQVVLHPRSTTNSTNLNGKPLLRPSPLKEGDSIDITYFRITIEQIVLSADASEPEIDPDITRPYQQQGQESVIPFDLNTGLLTSQVVVQTSGEFFKRLGGGPVVDLGEVRRRGYDYSETDYLALGGGLGSFVWVDYLRVYGVTSEQIQVIGNTLEPHERYRKLCEYSQIPEFERLRSNSDSCPDNIWGYPGYAAREIFRYLLRFNVGKALQIFWQIFNEPFTDTYTPIAKNVFDSITREMERIDWDSMRVKGRIEAVRKTSDGRYIVAYKRDGGRDYSLSVATYIHLAVGYPGTRFIPSLNHFRSDYAKHPSIASRVVNAYESHEHVYAELMDKGGNVIVRGRGIVASRILQKLGETRETLRNRKPGADLNIFHVMRSRRTSTQGNSYLRARRPVKHHVEIQPFNWPKACWGGDLRVRLERADDDARRRLLDVWGGTTTADRKDWQKGIRRSAEEGWYEDSFGEVKRLKPIGNGLLDVEIHDHNQSKTNLKAAFVIDATGLEASILASPILKDLVETYRLQPMYLDIRDGHPSNPRLRVNNDFEVTDMESHSRLTGRMYASGVATIGGPYAAVDSFLGLQYAALRSVEALRRCKAPGIRRMHPFRSFRQWLRWLFKVKP